MNRSVSSQAAALASAYSSALRSKKLWGAPGYVTRRCSVPAAVSAASNAAMASGVIPWSAPPNRPSTGEAIDPAMATGSGASLRHGPTSVPYIPITPARSRPSVPARNDIRPPMQNPIV